MEIESVSYNLILSVDKNGVIGNGKNNLAYRSSVDLLHFQTLTSRPEVNDTQNVVVMGRRTWDSLKGRHLKNRTNLVLSNSIVLDEETSNATTIKSWNELFEYVHTNTIRKVFIIGGKKVYEDFLKKYRGIIDKIYLTVFESQEYRYVLNMVNKFDVDNLKKGFKLEDNIIVKDLVKTETNARDMVINFETYKYDTSSSERMYMRHLTNVLTQPTRVTRNGIVRSSFGLRMVYDLSDGSVPLLTTKAVAWKTCIKELLWFLKGQTNNELLKKEGVNIWSANASSTFLKERGLEHYKEGDLGPIYGFQWRHSGANYENMTVDYTGKGIDQIESCLNQLLNDPYSRRIIVNSWNVSDLDKMALPPCHILFQWYLDSKGRLWIQLYQRSGDMFLGVPFNMFSYAVLLNLMCKKTDYKPGGIVHIIGDAHIYENHIDAVEKQLSRNPKEYPKLIINSKKEWKDYTIDDFEINDYNPHEKIFAPMSA
tara:strand:- start:42 stop:1487 length:1446 start_codon:yes stop_codon:yes gene_type:complete